METSPVLKRDRFIERLLDKQRDYYYIQIYKKRQIYKKNNIIISIHIYIQRETVTRITLEYPYIDKKIVTRITS